MKAWISPLFAALLCAFCLPVYGTPYVAIIKTRGGEERLEAIASESILNQDWDEVTLIPLTHGISAAMETLQKAFPKVRFRQKKLVSEKRFLTAQEAPDTFYAGWLINDTSPDSTPRTIRELYEKILPLPPLSPPANLDVEMTHESIPGAGLTIIRIDLPTRQELHTFNLRSTNHGYTLTFPPLAYTQASLSPIQLLSRGELEYLPINKLKKVIKQYPDALNWSHVNTFHSGNFGTVELFKAPDDSNHKMVMKKIKTAQEGFGSLSREAVFLDASNHEHIIRLMGMAVNPVSLTQSELWLALEYAPNGNMGVLIQDTPDTLTEDNINAILTGIVSAIQYLHGKDIAHRDIKPENILLFSDDGTALKAKLADFGLAVCTTHEQQAETSCGSPMYAPPELLSFKKRPYAKRVDSWSFGVLVRVSYTRELKMYPEIPSGVTTPEKLKEWRLKHKHLDLGTNVSMERFSKTPFKIPPPKGTKELIRWCFQHKAKNRPTIDEILEHPFFTSGSNPIKD